MDELAARRRRHEPRASAPRRPAVRAPVSWSIAVQDIVHDAYAQAADQLGVWPWDLRNALDQLKKELGSPERLRELYEITLHFIARARPEHPSPAGLPVDRAEARLYLWLRLYGHRN